jgi:nucleotide-binding universal stress UspA family protein
MLRTILVPLDGSALSEQALPVAARLAHAAGAALHIAHVHTFATANPITVEGMPVIDDELRSLAADHERAYLERVAAPLAAARLAPLTALLEGPVAPTLAAHARAIDADLIVLTSHGHSGFTHLWLGSVAETLVRGSGVPLLLLRPDASGAAGPFRRILAPLDGSATAEEILPHAAGLAALEGAELCLMRVIDTLPVPEIMPFAEHYRMGEALIAEARAQAEAALERAAERLRAGGASVSTLVTEGAQPTRAILEVCASRSVDLLALATHGRGGLRRAFLGGTADKLLRGAALPALIYRPPEPE